MGKSRVTDGKLKKGSLKKPYVMLNVMFYDLYPCIILVFYPCFVMSVIQVHSVSDSVVRMLLKNRVSLN